jgi:hypothetical protein
MNFNILSYCIYIPITFYITFVVGKICFNNGAVYLRKIINDNDATTSAINKILLIGYYLLNLGYASLMLSDWPQIHSLENALLILFMRIGKILFILGIMHYNNMLMTYLISRYLNKHSLLNH